MNTTLIAAALRALANAIESPADATPATSAPAAASAPATTSEAPKRGPGRPRLSAPTATAAPTQATAPATASPAAPSAAAPTAAVPATTGLTHAIVANDFKAAALAHGRDFVKGLLTAHGAPTFDKVKDLATFQAQLRAGPQAAPAPTGAADDLLG